MKFNHWQGRNRFQFKFQTKGGDLLSLTKDKLLGAFTRDSKIYISNTKKRGELDANKRKSKHKIAAVCGRGSKPRLTNTVSKEEAYVEMRSPGNTQETREHRDSNTKRKLS